jgi:hypothetical protein
VYSVECRNGGRAYSKQHIGEVELTDAKNSGRSRAQSGQCVSAEGARLPLVGLGLANCNGQVCRDLSTTQTILSSHLLRPVSSQDGASTTSPLNSSLAFLVQKQNGKSLHRRCLIFSYRSCPHTCPNLISHTSRACLTSKLQT